MNHRERVMTALSHEKPDRCPMQISFTPEFAARLEADLGGKHTAVHNPHGGGNTYALETYLEEDLLLTSVGWANSYYQGTEGYTDEWGIKWDTQEYSTPYGTGMYTEIIHNPLGDDNAVSSYKPPDPDREELYAESQRVIEQYKSEYWIVGVVVTTIFECAWALRGLDKMMMDFLLDPDLAHAILDIPFKYHLAAAKRLTRMGVDMLWFGDDVGGQNAMVLSPATWRTFLKPKMAELFSAVKSINPNVKVAYHSDGVIEPIIPELIEIGLDVLNPVQPASMNPANLKNEYGDKLCFWGSIDEQYTLPFGTVREVKEEVKERIQTIGENGGLILGPTHHVQLDTPLENFWAMHEAILNTEYDQQF